MSCKWDRDAEQYLVDGEPCRTDDYGDPTRHCTARRSCSQHIGPGELTCARCIGRARVNLRRIVEIAPLTATQALRSGVDSEAAYLAGPATDAQAWSERRVAMGGHLLTWERLGRITEKQYGYARATMEDDDEEHPYNVLTRWEFMLREDYDHERTTPTSIDEAGAYLDRQLGRLAQDPEQDFRLFADEVRHCREHLESVIRNGRDTERGAPCPDCKMMGRVVRMVRRYGHWCESDVCEKIHYQDDAGDRWVCPINSEHWMTPEGYAEWLRDRAETRPASA